VASTRPSTTRLPQRPLRSVRSMPADEPRREPPQRGS
jgi:hypothetical protein